MAKKRESRFNGIILINKPQGWTSFDVIAKLRGILQERRMGHGGTLDPMATGVLPVFVGGATKAVDYAAAQSKSYVAGFALGYATDTQDSTGTVTERSDRAVSADEVRAAVAGMQGEQFQLPPMYSAVQVDGRRLYDLARQGIEVEREKRRIILHELELLSYDERTRLGTLRVSCSKGTYVRTICHDLGKKLGTCAAMTSLVRTASGDFRLEQTHTLDEVQQAMRDGTAGQLFLRTDSLFGQYPAVEVDAYGANRAEHGAFIAPKHAKGMPKERGSLCRVYHDGVFLMLGKVGELDKGGPALFLEKRFL